MKTAIATALRWMDTYAEPEATDKAILAFLSAAKTQEFVVASNIEFDEWHAALIRPTAVMWRAASPVTPPKQRAALVTFLRAFADAGIADGGWRIFHAEHGDDSHDGLRYASRDLPDGWVLTDEHVLDIPVSRDQIRRFCDELDARGPLPWRVELAAELAEATGLSRAEATYLLAGLPDVYGLDSLTVDTVGLTEVTAESARDLFNELRWSACMALLVAAVPANPADLWPIGPDVAGIVEECVTHLGRRTSAPEDVLAAAEKELPEYYTYIGGVLNPDTCSWLHVDAYTEDAIEMSTGGFQPEHWVAATELLRWLAANLPAGSPLHGVLPCTRELVRERLRNPHFSVEFGYVDDDKAALLDLLGLPRDTTDHEAGWLRLTGYEQVTYLHVEFAPADYTPAHRQDLETAVTFLRGEGEVSPDTVLAFYDLPINQQGAEHA